MMMPSPRSAFAKPASGAFEQVRRRLDADGRLAPDTCLHVGDSIREDVVGALGAGLRTAWLDREGTAADDLPGGVPRITSLAELPGLLRQSSS